MTAGLIEPEDLLALRDAVIARLSAAGAFPKTLQQVQDDAGSLPEYYTEVTVVARHAERTRLNGANPVLPFRIYTQVVASAEETVYEVLRRVDGGLRGFVVEAGGYRSTPIQHETSDVPEPDNGRWSALVAWTSSRTQRRKVVTP